MIYHKFEVRIDWFDQYYNTYNIEESISGNKNRFYIYWEPKNNIFDNLKIYLKSNRLFIIEKYAILNHRFLSQKSINK